MAQTTVLVVDDSLIVRKVITNVLERSGFTSLSVSSGEEALDVVRRETVGCMILDLHMGGLAGFEVLEIIEREGLDIPVIVLTADLQEASRTKAEGLGANAFLNKPFNQTEILSAIEHVTQP